MHHLWWGSWLFYLTKSSLFFEWWPLHPSKKVPRCWRLPASQVRATLPAPARRTRDAKRWLKHAEATFKPSSFQVMDQNCTLRILATVNPCESSWKHQPWPCRVGSSIELETPFWTFQTQNTLGRVLKWVFIKADLVSSMSPTRKAPWSKHIELSIPVEHISKKKHAISFQSQRMCCTPCISTAQISTVPTRAVGKWLGW